MLMKLCTVFVVILFQLHVVSIYSPILNLGLEPPHGHLGMEEGKKERTDNLKSGLLVKDNVKFGFTKTKQRLVYFGFWCKV